ncbi:claudin-15 isoform X3 [Neovison vison]|uniref:claudin-15 isoform X3 n=1 Tax=Neovison vison TaxID=452646 RepID=UPI001CF0B087|nr:claudin-15 isoform X3 [Neogale vison]
MKAESETLPLGSHRLRGGGALLDCIRLFRHSHKSSPPPSWGGEPGGWGRGWTFGLFLLFPPSLRQQLPGAGGSFLCPDLPGSSEPGERAGTETRRQTRGPDCSCPPFLAPQPALAPHLSRSPSSSWRVSTVHGSVITTNTIFENLWFSCATDSMGVYNCREFPSLLALSGYIQACRALMITAIFLGFLGLFLGIVGLRCVNIGSMELSRKAKLAATAGALHILAGLCGMVAISWYAFNITQEFFDPLYPGTKYELGPALYLGWSASLLAILGGFCLGSGCCRAPDADQAPRFPYKASVVRSPVLTGGLRPAASDEGDSTFGKYGKNAYV